MVMEARASIFFPFKSNVSALYSILGNHGN